MKTIEEPFYPGDTVKIVLTIEAQLYSDNAAINKKELIDMLYEDDAYGLKSIVANDIHELCYTASNIDIERTVEKEE
jgi:hypothetical protein